MSHVALARGCPPKVDSRFSRLIEVFDRASAITKSSIIFIIIRNEMIPVGRKFLRRSHVCRRVGSLVCSFFHDVGRPIFFLKRTREHNDSSATPRDLCWPARRGVPQVVVVVVSRAKARLGTPLKGHPKWHSSHGHSPSQLGLMEARVKVSYAPRPIPSILRHDASALGCCGHRLVDIPSRFQRLDAVEG